MQTGAPPFYVNAESLIFLHRGDILPISKQIADSLKRTGKSARNTHDWSITFQVYIPGCNDLCDLRYWGNGKILIQLGSDL